MTLLSAKDATARLSGLTRAFLGYGADKDGDIDTAFDDAVEGAGHDYGFAGTQVSVASIDADAVSAHAEHPAPIGRAAMLAERALRAGELEPGRGYGWAVAPDSAFSRRRLRVSLDDVALHIPGEPGGVLHVSADLEQTLRAAAAAAGTPVQDDEELESAVLVRTRARFKPITEVFRTKSAGEFAVIDPARQLIVARGLPTASAAKKAAVELVKAGPIGDDPTGHLDVVKLVGREGGNPLQRITRTRVASTIVVKLTVVREKNADKTKTVGWLFAGTVEP